MSDGPRTKEPDGPEVGWDFQTPGRTITEADVVAFAALTGDWHPQHADATWAARSQFGERVAHGMLLLSYAVGLVPLDPSRVVALRGLDRVVFKRPALIGDTIHVEGHMESAKPLDESTALATLRWRIVNQSGATIARATVEVVLRRGGAPAEAGANGGSRAAPEHASGEPSERQAREVYL
jgi:3-hydroxybutyryl-CoA dehydratase